MANGRLSSPWLRNLEPLVRARALAYSELMALVLTVGALGLALDSAARWLCRHGAHGV